MSHVVTAEPPTSNDTQMLITLIIPFYTALYIFHIQQVFFSNNQLFSFAQVRPFPNIRLI